MGPKASNREERLKGIAVSKGAALARACLFAEDRHSVVDLTRKRSGSADDEVHRLENALGTVEGQLAELRERVEKRIGQAEAEIFVAQTMILKDPHVRERMERAVRQEHAIAEAAVARVLDVYELRMRKMESPYLRERASDIGEVKRRLLDVLARRAPSLRCRSGEHCARGRDRIVFARELTPSLTVELQMEDLRGFVTEHGGATSHAAILARSLGIPAVSGLPGIYERVSCGDEVLVDGDAGEVILWPSAATAAAYGPALHPAGTAQEPEEPVPGLAVMANISLAADVQDAVRMKAEGIGLYRTEFEFLAAGRILDSEEQYRRYAHVVRAMQGRPVCIRLLDMGGDKAASFLGIAPEANPSLGFRGSRLLLGRPELIEAQVRAIARAARFGEVWVLYPMVVDLEQFRQLRAIVDRAAGARSRRLRHGVMFEVPSACLQARRILREADFGSIGTNDLIQYLFAVDRNNELVAADFTPDRPALWELLEDISRAAMAEGKPLSLCGELGGSSTHIARLMRIGIRSISASARMIPVVRRAARAAVKIQPAKSRALRKSRSQGPSSQA